MPYYRFQAAQSVIKALSFTPSGAIKIYMQGVDHERTGRPEARYIGSRDNVTRAEVAAFYRKNIGGLITGVVDAEFGQNYFLLKDSPNGSYGVVLTHNTQNQYGLSYEGCFNGTMSTKTLPPVSLETLLDTMRRNPSDFNQANIDHVRNEAALIPAAGLGRDSLNEIKGIVERFYLRPAAETYGYLKDVYALYTPDNIGIRAINNLYQNINSSYIGTLSSLSQPLARKVMDEKFSGITLSRELQQKLLPPITIR